MSEHPSPEPTATLAPERAYELSGNQYLLTDLLEHGQGYGPLMEDMSEGVADNRAVLDALVWTQHAAYSGSWKVDDTNAWSMLTSTVRDLNKQVIGKTAGIDRIGAQGYHEYQEIVKKLDDDPDLRFDTQARLFNQFRLLELAGLIREDQSIPVEISQHAAVSSLLGDGYDLFEEAAVAHDKSGDTARGEVWEKQGEVSDVFSIVKRRLESGKLRVFITHDQESSHLSPGDLRVSSQIIEIRAEDAKDFAEKLLQQLNEAGINPEKVVDKTGLSLEEIALRNVLIHELAHALHYASDDPETTQRLYLLEHPEDAVSMNFEDALAAERERFAEGLAVHYMRNLLHQAGFEDTVKLDKLTDSIQRYWIVGFKDWYTASKGTPSSLGNRDNFSNGANLGYGLPLDIAELLDRLSFLAKHLHANRDDYARMQSKVGALVDFGDGWAEYLKKSVQRPELDHVHEAVDQAVNDDEQIKSAAAKAQEKQIAQYERNVKHNRRAKAFSLVAGGLAAGMMFANLVQDYKSVKPVGNPKIEAVDGNHYVVDEAFPDGHVLFELQEPATQANIYDGVAALGADNFVIGHSDDGRTIYIGRTINLETVEAQSEVPSISGVNEIYQRLPDDLRDKVQRSPRLFNEGGFAEIVNRNWELTENSDETLVFAYDMEAIIQELEQATE